jgi:multicomponent K+:H+ antiporter subunit G
MIVEGIISFLLVFGGFLTFLGSLGIVKLPDYYMRLHGPAKNTTLGLGAILLASAVFFSVEQSAFVFRDVLITLFLFLTAPISAHLMAKSALHLDREFVDQHRGDESGEFHKPSEHQGGEAAE